MSTNISGEKRKILLSKIAEIKSFIEQNANDKNASQLLTYLVELSREVNGKKYGLVFEEHREKIDEILEQNAPVFTEEKDLFIDNGGELNFLLEGDNLASLKLLEKTHRGKIDVIYIDPPYNTGIKSSDGGFKYDDCFVNPEDSFKHSKWLSFMKSRLEVAKNLLNNNGFILLSIDDREQAPLKMLCDEILGASNFINQFIWQRNSSGKTEKDKYTVNTEYVLLYAKSKNYILSNVYKPLAQSSIKLYKFDDNDGRGKYATVSLQKPADPGPETSYDYVDNKGKVWKCPPKGWRMIFDKIKQLENDNRLVFGNTLRVKDYWNERESEGKRIDTLWTDIAENTVGSSELEDILNVPNLFNNPKPTELISRCIKINGNKFAIILDFFAGSGTTGHAVLKLNSEDGGHRKFILCTNNENNICRDITYQRLKTVITGKRKDGSNYSDGLPASLKYFKTDFIPINEKMYYEYADELLLHVRELVELENAVNFDKDKTVAIVLDDDEMEEFIDAVVSAGSTTTKVLYVGHDVLLSSRQEQILKSHNISVNVIPDYYYRDLAL